MMEKLVLVLLGCLPLIVHGQAPAFCPDFDCPSPTYNVTENSTEYEVRQYEPTSWVVTNSRLSGNWSSAYELLDFYLDGRNDKNQTINRTVPFWEAYRGSNITFMYYLGIDNPPNPTNPKLSLLDLPRMSFYVRSSTSYNAEYSREWRRLKKALDNQSLSYDTSVDYVGHYCSPWFYTIGPKSTWSIESYVRLQEVLLVKQ